MPQIDNFVKLLILKGFANYYDRKVFYYSSADDYDSAAADSMDLIESYNFNPNDGIETVIPIRSSDEMLLSCNYLLVLTNDAAETIISRWYIMDCVRKGSEIYEVTLRRDVVAESIKDGTSDFANNAPIYVERGILDEGSPLIFNDEGLNLNQMKVSEELIQDEFEQAWLVGYFDAATPSTTINVTLPGRGAYNYKTLEQIKDATGIPVATLEALMDGTEIKFAIDRVKFEYGFKGRSGILQPIRSIIQELSADCTEVFDYETMNRLAWDHPVAIAESSFYYNDFAESGYNYILDDDLSPVATIKAALTDVLDNQEAGAVYLSEDQLASLMDILSLYAVYRNGNYYSVNLEATSIAKVPEIVVSKSENSWFDGLIRVSVVEYAAMMENIEETNDWEIYINYKAKSIKANVSPAAYTGGNVSIYITGSRNILEDNPYCMFAIPYGPIKYRHTVEGNERIESTDLNKDESLRVATEIARQLGKNLYDLQILPYAPNIVRSNTIWGLEGGPVVDFVSGYTFEEDYNEIVDGDNNVLGFIFFEKKSSISIVVNKTMVSQHGLKVDSQTDFYRICSPNYNGVFEFNLAKNGGRVRQFYIDCTYKPINPFIRVVPMFDALYGGNFKDGRGLICGGDFSLAIIENNWINYEQYNKNYAAIFARDIQNLEFKQSQERFKEPFAVLSGTAVGAGAGAVAGAKFGGGYGAIAGAALGAGAGVVGGAIDMSLNEKRRAEDKNYSRERFNLNLASIKAQPQSLAKNSVLTIINKIWPFIERYTCTPREVTALEDKIKYHGMTVNVIGNIAGYINSTDTLEKDRGVFYYFKGELIHADGIEEDDHYIATLYNELAKGVYI